MFGGIPISSQNYGLQQHPTPGPMTTMIGRKFPCANCTSVFSRKGGLTYHQKFECGQKPRFNCPYCTYRAKHISNARRHVRKCHPGREVYTVDLCQLQQGTVWRLLQRRIGGLHDPKGFVPRRIGQKRAFQSLYAWNGLGIVSAATLIANAWGSVADFGPVSHFDRTRIGRKSNEDVGSLAGIKYPCHKCPSEFSRKKGLNYHLRYECGLGPRFGCPYCEYRTKHVSNARAHVRRKHPYKKVYTVDLFKKVLENGNSAKQWLSLCNCS